MNNGTKSDSNNLQSFASLSPQDTKKQKDLNGNSTQCSCQKDEKSAGSNDWDSVPTTYDKDESMHKHEKTATNNQWTSTSK